MRKISRVLLILILVFSITGTSLANGSQVYQSLEKYLFTRIVDMDTEWDYSHYTGEDTGTVTIFRFNVTAELWNSADETLTISYGSAVPYFLRKINLESKEITSLNGTGDNGIDTDIEFVPGVTSYSFNAVIISKYVIKRYPPGNYEIYFGEHLRLIGNSFSAFLEITENSTTVSYDDIPPEWGETYDITLSSTGVSHPTEIAFLPTPSMWISIIGIITIFSVKRSGTREETIVH